MAAVAQPVRRAYTPIGAIAAAARRASNDNGAVQWPFTKWRDDPVAFAREVLGVELWWAQIKILESIRDHRNTTVRSGHKIGKSTAVAIAALWFYSSFDRARVIITAVKASQIDEAIWKEVRRLYRESKIPLGGTIFELARSGLRDGADGRQILGVTARDGEGLAGISSPNILILADEASGINDRFFEVLGSSLACDGGVARKCYISNPTRTTGEFYRSHTTLAHMFNCLAFSSEDTPNARGEKGIRGLAGPTWIKERELEYGGVDSPKYRVRVKGEFVHDKDGKIISLDLIAMAEEAWDETPDEGDLQLGVDPAGDGVLGDETAIAVRLGKKIITVLAWLTLTEDRIVESALELLGQFRLKSRGTPRIALDVEGGIGTRVYEKLRVAVEKAHTDVEIVPVRSGKKMWGSPEFDLVRDALWGQAQKFLRAGGAIPTDVKLSQELNAPSFTPDENQRYVATPKKELRKLLDRSPDRGDATCLAIWGYEGVQAEQLAAAAAKAPAQPAPAAGDAYEHANTTIDAYEVDGLGARSDGVYS